MIRLLIGDKSRRPNSVSLEQLTNNKARIKQLIGTRFLLDLDLGRFDARKLRTVLKGCKINIDLRTNSYEKYEKIKDLVDEVHDSGGNYGFNLFGLLKRIFSSEDRNGLFLELEKWNPPLEFLLKWIIGNLAEEDKENRDLVNLIDGYLYSVDKRLVHLLISFIEPIYPENMRFYYYFKKREE